jgi:hypothetical protein
MPLSIAMNDLRRQSGVVVQNIYALVLDFFHENISDNETRNKCVHLKQFFELKKSLTAVYSIVSRLSAKVYCLSVESFVDSGCAMKANNSARGHADVRFATALRTSCTLRD